MMTPKPYTQDARMRQEQFLPGSVHGRAVSTLVIVNTEVIEIPTFSLDTASFAQIFTTITAKANANITLAAVPFTLLLFEGTAVDEDALIGVDEATTLNRWGIFGPVYLPPAAELAHGSDGHNLTYFTRVNNSTGSTQSVTGICQARILLPVGGEVEITNEVITS